MRRTATLALLAAMAAPAGALPPAGPANPLTLGGVVCVSREGVTCFHADSGTPAWRALQGRQTLALAGAGDRLLVAGSDGLTALARDSGQTLWQLQRLGPVVPAETAGHRAWLGSRDGHVAMVDTRDGRLLWSVDLGQWVYTPARAAGLLVTGGRDAVLYALDPADGRLVWQRPLPQELVYRPVAAGEASVLVATFDGALRRVDARTGEDLWAAPGGAPAFELIARDGRAHALRMGGVLDTHDLVDGRALWRHRGAATAMTLHDGRLLVSSDAGALQSLDPATGQVLEQHQLGRPLVGSAATAGAGSVAVTDHPLSLRRLGGIPAPASPATGGTHP